MKRLPNNPRLKPDIWASGVYPASLRATVLWWIIRGDYGPITSEEREACEYWLALRTLEAAARK